MRVKGKMFCVRKMLAIILAMVIALCGCGKAEETGISQETDEESNVSQGVDENNDTTQDTDEDNDTSQDSNEYVYFLPADDSFYELIASNPINVNYEVDYDHPMQTYVDSLDKTDGWNKQIDFTVEKLRSLLNESEYEELKAAVELWHEYYQEQRCINPELCGTSGLILGSMYTQTSAEALEAKCEFVANILLSWEYELTNEVSFSEEAVKPAESTEYKVSQAIFCIEYANWSIEPYSDAEKLKTLISETAAEIEEEFGHEFAAHSDKFVSFIEKICDIEKSISDNEEQCNIIKANRLRLFATELWDIENAIKETLELFDEE